MNNSYMGFILIALLFVVFYFMLIRPQQKRMRQQMELINSLKAGDDVMTSSGIYGTISEVEEETVLLEISEDVQIRMAKSAVTRVFKEPSEEEPEEEESEEEETPEDAEAVEETPENAKAAEEAPEDAEAAEDEAAPGEEKSWGKEPEVSGEASNDGKKK